MSNYHLDFDFERLVMDVERRIGRFVTRHDLRLRDVVRSSATGLSQDDLRAVYMRLIDTISERALINYLSRTT